MDEILKDIIDVAKRVFLKDGYHAPILFVKGARGKITISFKEFGGTNSERVSAMLNAGRLDAIANSV